MFNGARLRRQPCIPQKGCPIVNVEFVFEINQFLGFSVSHFHEPYFSRNPMLIYRIIDWVLDHALLHHRLHAIDWRIYSNCAISSWKEVVLAVVGDYPLLRGLMSVCHYTLWLTGRLTGILSMLPHGFLQERFCRKTWSLLVVRG